MLRTGLNAHLSVPCLRGWFSVPAVPSTVSFLHIYLPPICQGPGNAPSLIMYPTACPLPHCLRSWASNLLFSYPHLPVTDWPGGWHRAGANKCLWEERMGACTATSPRVWLALGVRTLSSHGSLFPSHRPQPTHTPISESLGCCLSFQILRIGDPRSPEGSSAHLKSDLFTFPSSPTFCCDQVGALSGRPSQCCGCQL